MAGAAALVGAAAAWFAAALGGRHREVAPSMTWSFSGPRVRLQGRPPITTSRIAQGGGRNSETYVSGSLLGPVKRARRAVLVLIRPTLPVRSIAMSAWNLRASACISRFCGWQFMRR